MSLLRLLVDSERRLLLSRVGVLSGAATPVFFAGDKVSLEVSIVRPTSVSEFPFEFLPTAADDAVKVFLGLDSAVPVAGVFRISDGTDTAELPISASVSDLESAINNFDEVVSSGTPCSVEALGSGFLIRHPLSGSTLALSVDSSQLFPKSASVLLEAVESGPTSSPAWILRFERGSVASVELAREVVDPTPAATPVVAWTSAASPAVVDLYIGEATSGFANFIFEGLDSEDNPATFSFPIFAGSSSATAFSVIRAAMSNAKGSLLRVEQLSPGAYRVTHRFEPGPISSNDGWSVEDSLVGFVRYTGELDLTDPDVEENLAGLAEVNAVLEVRLVPVSGPPGYTLAAPVVPLKSRLR